MAYELGSDLVRVNAVAPGSVETPIFRSNLQRLSEEQRRAFHIFVEQHYPLGGRTGSPDEVADAVVFLASSAARWINGAILHVDGGLVVS